MVRSLGFRTDLALLRFQGSVVHRRDGYLAVRSPHHPAFHWGNFLLLDQPPAPGAATGWVDTFHRDFPDADHIAIGVDGTEGAAGDPAELTAAGLTVDRYTILTAPRLSPPPRPNTEAECRQLASDADWTAAAALRLADDTTPIDHTEDYHAFTLRRTADYRRMHNAGHGRWFGAFLAGRLVASLGVFATGDGLARYQSVDTHPDYRNRGLAGTLVHTAGEYALEHLDVHTLVIGADPDYHAIRVYRALGFTDAETETRLSRTPNP